MKRRCDIVVQDARQSESTVYGSGVLSSLPSQREDNNKTVASNPTEVTLGNRMDDTEPLNNYADIQ